MTFVNLTHVLIPLSLVRKSKVDLQSWAKQQPRSNNTAPSLTRCSTSGYDGIFERIKSRNLSWPTQAYGSTFHASSRYSNHLVGGLWKQWRNCRTYNLQYVLLNSSLWDSTVGHKELLDGWVQRREIVVSNIPGNVLVSWKIFQGWPKPFSGLRGISHSRDRKLMVSATQ